MRHRDLPRPGSIGCEAVLVSIFLGPRGRTPTRRDGCPDDGVLGGSRACLLEAMVAGPRRMVAGPKRMDAGLKRMDAGLKRMDAGLRRMDAGSSRMDAGSSRMDAGLKRMD